MIGIDAFIVPTDDPHMSEYTAPYFSRREFISGFTGSAGTAVITKNNAALFTDGRYFAQAEKELSSDWELMKQGMKGVPTISEFLIKQLEPNSVVGVDPYVHSAGNLFSFKFLSFSFFCLFVCLFFLFVFVLSVFHLLFLTPLLYYHITFITDKRNA